MESKNNNLVLIGGGLLFGCFAYKYVIAPMYNKEKYISGKGGKVMLNKTNVSLQAQERGSNPSLMDGTDAEFVYEPKSHPEVKADPNSKSLPVAYADLYSETRRNMMGLHHTASVRYGHPSMGKPHSDVQHPISEKSVRLQVKSLGDHKAARQMDALSR
jgi:hypothetical protein